MPGTTPTTLFVAGSMMWTLSPAALLWRIRTWFGAATVVEIAARLGLERVQQQPALSEVTEQDTGHDNLEVFPGLFVIPRRGSGRQRLQSHRRTLRMTGNTSGVTLSLGQEDRLYFRFEELKIQTCRSRGLSFLRPDSNRGRALNH